jgi:hypothetical protein
VLPSADFVRIIEEQPGPAGQNMIDEHTKAPPLPVPEVQENRWGAFVLMLMAAFGAIAIALLGLQTFANQLDITSRFEGPIRVAGAVVAGIVTIIFSMRQFYAHNAKLAAIVVSVVIVFFVGLALLLVFTNDETDLNAGSTLHGVVGANDEVVHHFSVHDGDRAVVTVVTQASFSGDLLVQHGDDPYRGAPDDAGVMRVDETLTGGVWEVTIRSSATSPSRYALTLKVDQAREVRAGEALDSEVLVDAKDTNGYVLDPTTAGNLFVVVDGASPPDLMPDVSLVINGFRRNLKLAQEAVAIQFDFKRGENSVIIVRSTSGAAGTYRLALLTESSYKNAASVPNTVAKPPAIKPGGRQVSVPDVYDTPQASAENALIAAGFPVKSFNVCSSSVAQGQVRQVFVADNPTTIVVDKPSTSGTKHELPAGTELSLKVSTGTAC